jgi:hypothetical protein
MGCSTCKSKRKNNKQTKEVTFEDINGGGDNNTPPKRNMKKDTFSGNSKILKDISEIAPENIFMKITVFCSVLVAIPLLALYLIGYVFTTFFLNPKNNLGGISFIGLFKFLTYPKRRWKQIRGRIRERAKQREFAKTVGYDDMSEIDVFVNEELKEKREYTGEEELEGVELLETTNKDNDNG